MIWKTDTEKRFRSFLLNCLLLLASGLIHEDCFHKRCAAKARAAGSGW
jgi:hypothetical protein